MEQILNTYYANGAQKLHGIVNKILLKFGGLSDKDMDDFYSLANEVFTEALKRYDNEQSFDGYLYSCLSNKIKTEMTRRNRYKRKMDRMTVSIDMPLDDEENITLADLIADDFDMEKEILGEDNIESSKIEKYFGRLSRKQKRVAELLAASYSAGEIQKILHMTQKEYSDAIQGIYAFENISILF